jgi:hypothetical protein
MEDTYTPVPYEYREQIQEEIRKGSSGKIFFFDSQEKVGEAVGPLTQLVEIPGEGIFAIVNGNDRVRIDKIITVFGKPGAAYDKYEAFGNVCLECTGGYEI